MSGGGERRWSAAVTAKQSAARELACGLYEAKCSAQVWRQRAPLPKVEEAQRVSEQVVGQALNCDSLRFSGWLARDGTAWGGCHGPDGPRPSSAGLALLLLLRGWVPEATGVRTSAWGDAPGAYNPRRRPSAQRRHLHESEGRMPTLMLR